MTDDNTEMFFANKAIALTEHQRQFEAREKKQRRDHFAGLAMQGILAADFDGLEVYRTFAAEAVKYADALIKELDK